MSSLIDDWGHHSIIGPTVAIWNGNVAIGAGFLMGQDAEATIKEKEFSITCMKSIHGCGPFKHSMVRLYIAALC